MFILSSICSGLEFWSVNYSSTWKNCALNVFTKTNFLDEISKNLPNDLLETNSYKTLESCW